MTPINSLIAAKACISASEAAELQKRYAEAIKQGQDAIVWIAEWLAAVKEEQGYTGADFDNAALSQWRYDNWQKHHG